MQLDETDLLAEINRSGIVYADCESEVYQGITCPKCGKTNLRYCPVNRPFIDLRKFIITPCLVLHFNIVEQFFYRQTVSQINQFLRFKYIQAWNDIIVSFQYLSEFAEESRVDIDSRRHPQYIPYRLKKEEVGVRLKQENDTGQIHLRRLYPANPKFKSMLTCLSPNKLTEIENIDGHLGLRAEGNTLDEIKERKDAWITLLQEATGTSLKESIIGKLKDRGLLNIEEGSVDSQINERLFLLNFKPTEKLRDYSRYIGFEIRIDDSLKNQFKKLYYEICTKVALTSKRNEFTRWKDKIEKGILLPEHGGKKYKLTPGFKGVDDKKENQE